MNDIKFYPNKSGIFPQNPTIKSENLALQTSIYKNQIKKRQSTDFYKYTNKVMTPFMKFNNLSAIKQK